MDTDIEKVLVRARIWGTIVLAMTMGVWELVEESAMSLSPTIGDFLMNFLENKFGIKINGVEPKGIMEELGEAFVSGLNYADSYTVEQSGNTITVTQVNALGTKDFAVLANYWGEKQFSNAFYCAGISALIEAGKKVHGDIIMDAATSNQIITFEVM